MATETPGSRRNGVKEAGARTLLTTRGVVSNVIERQGMDVRGRLLQLTYRQTLDMVRFFHFKLSSYYTPIGDGFDSSKS